MNIVVFCKTEKTEIGHDSYNSGIFGKGAFLFHVVGKNGNHLVTVYHVAVFIHRQTAVGISVKRNAELTFVDFYEFGQRFNMGRATVLIDVCAVGFCVKNNCLRAEILKQLVSGSAGAAVGAVNCYFDSF